KFNSTAEHLHLHSFPTRRSSDLIYNYRRLAEQLRARGHRFTTSSDTEVIVHAWEEFGEDCLAEFDGMFAFVIWDAERQTLFAARDRKSTRLNSSHGSISYAVFCL